MAGRAPPSAGGRIARGGAPGGQPPRNIVALPEYNRPHGAAAVAYVADGIVVRMRPVGSVELGPGTTSCDTGDVI